MSLILFDTPSFAGFKGSWIGWTGAKNRNGPKLCIEEFKKKRRIHAQDNVPFWRCQHYISFQNARAFLQLLRPVETMVKTSRYTHVQKGKRHFISKRTSFFAAFEACRNDGGQVQNRLSHIHNPVKLSWSDFAPRTGCFLLLAAIVLQLYVVSRI